MGVCVSVGASVCDVSMSVYFQTVSQMTLIYVDVRSFFSISQ